MNGRIVIVGYKPKPGKINDLIRLVNQHHSRLGKIGLVTDRKPVIAKAEDGTVVEIFEWASEEAIQSAHEHPEVNKMWEEFSEVCEYVPVGELPEMSRLFSEFDPVS